MEILNRSSQDTTRTARRTAREFLLLQAAFLLVSPFLLRLVGVFSVETYFMAAFVWFLVTVEVMEPRDPEIDLWRWVWWVKVVCFAVLAFVISRHAATLLQ